MSSSLERENARLRAERNDLRAVVQAKEGTIRGLEVAHANAETAVQRLDDLGRQVVDLTRESDHFQRCLDRASDELDRAYARIRELEHENERQARLLRLHLEMTTIDRDLLDDLRHRADERALGRKRARSMSPPPPAASMPRARSRSPAPSPPVSAPHVEEEEEDASSSSSDSD